MSPLPLGIVASAGPALGTPTFDLLATTAPTGSTSLSIDVSGISSSYKHLYIVGPYVNENGGGEVYLKLNNAGCMWWSQR